MSETKKRTRTPPKPLSHFCDWDAAGGRVVRALCSVVIRRRDHSNTPNCPNCQAALALREKLNA